MGPMQLQYTQNNWHISKKTVESLRHPGPSCPPHSVSTSCNNGSDRRPCASPWVLVRAGWAHTMHTWGTDLPPWGWVARWGDSWEWGFYKCCSQSQPLPELGDLPSLSPSGGAACMGQFTRSPKSVVERGWRNTTPPPFPPRNTTPSSCPTCQSWKQHQRESTSS